MTGNISIEDREFYAGLLAQVPWRPGDTKQASGVTFTFTMAGGWNGRMPCWAAGALAHRVFVIRPMVASHVPLGPCNLRVDGVRFWYQSLDRALHKAVKWKEHTVRRARAMVEEYDAAAVDAVNARSLELAHAPG